MSNSQDLRLGVSCGLLITWFVASFDEFAVVKVHFEIRWDRLAEAIRSWTRRT